MLLTVRTGGGVAGAEELLHGLQLLEEDHVRQQPQRLVRERRHLWCNTLLSQHDVMQEIDESARTDATHC